MVEMAVVAGRQPEVVADWAAEDSGAAVQEEAVVTDLEAVEADLMAAEEDLAVLVAEVEEAQVEDLEAEEVEAELAAVDLAAQVADLAVPEELVRAKVALVADKGGLGGVEVETAVLAVMVRAAKAVLAVVEADTVALVASDWVAAEWVAEAARPQKRCHGKPICSLP